jgi:hypothetical protein
VSLFANAETLRALEVGYRDEADSAAKVGNVKEALILHHHAAAYQRAADLLDKSVRRRPGTAR